MLLLASVVYFLQSDCFAVAAPVQNLTTLDTEIAPAWVANPAGRGTWDLLYSCTFTIFLCVYTAIHLNVPPEESHFRFWLRKTKWVFIAILAPEIVVYTAFEQWVLSRNFLKKLNKFVDESTDESTDKKTKSWVKSYDAKCRFDMVYAQYAVMGGFAADIQHLHNAITERVTISTSGILFMAEHGVFCQVRKDDIEDKSKADLLAKGLVCVQVLWVAGQAIERKVAGFPITLIEVHTLAHVVCAIVMYALWIRKPLNVKDPTMVDFRDAPEILGLIVESSSIGIDRSGFKLEGMGLVPFKTRLEPQISWYIDPSREAIQLEAYENDGLFEISSPVELTQDPTEERVQFSTLYYYTHTDVSGVTHFYGIGDSLQNKSYVPVSDAGTVYEMVMGQTSALGYGVTNTSSHKISLRHLQNSTVVKVSLSEKDISRLNSTAKFLAKIKPSTIGSPRVPEYPLDEDFHLPDKVLAFSLKQLYYNYTGRRLPVTLLIRRTLNYTGEIFDTINSETAYLVTAMAIIPAAYGCVHIGALSIIFPSSAERLLWKISCYYLIAMAGVSGIFGLFIYLNSIIDHKWNIDISEIIKKMMESFFNFVFDHGYFMRNLGVGIILTIVSIMALTYAGARIFIVLESFLSLRHVPVGVYSTPDINFMNYIPHL